MHNDESLGYLPLKRIIKSIQNKDSIREGLHDFFKVQNCLIQGMSNLKRLRRLFSKLDILDTTANKVFVLDTNTYITFSTVEIYGGQTTDKHIDYVYNSDVFLEIYNSFKYSQQIFNYSEVYDAFNFLNQKVDLIIDYFKNIYKTDFEYENSCIENGLQNIVFSDAKKYISPIQFAPTVSNTYHSTVTSILDELLEFTLENFTIKDLCFYTELVNNKNVDISISVTINNGTLYSNIVNINKTTPHKHKEIITLSKPSKKKLITIYPTDDFFDSRSEIDFSFMLQNLCYEFNMKEKLKDKLIEAIERTKSKV